MTLWGCNILLLPAQHVCNICRAVKGLNQPWLFSRKYGIKITKGNTSRRSPDPQNSVESCQEPAGVVCRSWGRRNETVFVILNNWLAKKLILWPKSRYIIICPFNFRFNRIVKTSAPSAPFLQCVDYEIVANGADDFYLLPSAPLLSGWYIGCCVGEQMEQMFCKLFMYSKEWLSRTVTRLFRLRLTHVMLAVNSCPVCGYLMPYLWLIHTLFAAISCWVLG